MRRLVLAALLALAACEVSETQLRQVTIESPESLGLSLREVPASVLRSIGLGYGLSVVKAGSVAERAGLRLGDVIYAVNEQRLHSIEDFTRMVADRPRAQSTAGPKKKTSPPQSSANAISWIRTSSQLRNENAASANARPRARRYVIRHLLPPRSSPNRLRHRTARSPTNGVGPAPPPLQQNAT